MSKVRVRTHANPLSFREAISRDEWIRHLDKTKDISVDFGSGQGEFLVENAKAHPENNYIGIEVRKPMVERVNVKINKEQLDNAICLVGNGAISLSSLFLAGEVKEFFIQFPDPWLKNKHHKRRIINSFVIEELYNVLSSEGSIYFITDVKEVYDDFFGMLTQKFKASAYEEKKEKSYWHKWHVKQGTTLYSSCFTK